MARHINADKLFAFIDKQTHLSKGKLLNYIRENCTTDVAEVKHGEWIYHECVSSHEGAISGYSCSECRSFVDEETFEMDEFHKDFCGACGAKMDGGKTE